MRSGPVIQNASPENVAIFEQIHGKSLVEEHCWYTPGYTFGKFCYTSPDKAKPCNKC